MGDKSVRKIPHLGEVIPRWNADGVSTGREPHTSSQVMPTHIFDAIVNSAIKMLSDQQLKKNLLDTGHFCLQDLVIICVTESHLKKGFAHIELTPKMLNALTTEVILLELSG